MTIAETEYGIVLKEIANFTGCVVQIAQAETLPVTYRADLIFQAEKILQEFIMDRIVTKCENASIPSNN